MSGKTCATFVSVAGSSEPECSEVDVLVRGAGPAGIVAAIWLARAGSTVALVRRPAASPLDRIEALGPDIVASLRKIGLSRSWLRKFAQPVPGTVSRWASESEEVQDYMMSPHGVAWSTRRECFDQALLEYAVSQGVRIVDKDVPATVAWMAVGSDSALEGEADDNLIALTRNYSGCSAGDRRLRIEAVPHGWWYALRADRGVIGLGFLTDRQSLRHRSPEDLWSVALSDPLQKMVESGSPGPLRTVPVRCAFVAAGDHRIGNARAAYDPLTGRGVAEAVRNALETVSLPIEERRASIVRLEGRYRNYIRERQRLYELGAERFKTGFWTRRLSSRAKGEVAEAEPIGRSA